MMMSAEGNLSHTPGGGWACYNATGAATAAVSNLALGVNGKPPRARAAFAILPRMAY